MEIHLQRIAAIAAGGAVGAVCRYGIMVASVRVLGAQFPFGVLVANVLGCFLLGLIMHEALVAHRWLPMEWHAALTIGLLGSLTTFSTFGYDTLRLLETGRHLAAGVNIVANCLLGIATCWLGAAVARAWWPAG